MSISPGDPASAASDSSLPLLDSAVPVEGSGDSELAGPDYELSLFVQGEPSKLRRVQVRVVARSAATPNPILPTDGG